jgi:hypothetical protein
LEPVVADCYRFYEEQDRIRIEMKSRTRICNKVKSCIRIRSPVPFFCEINEAFLSYGILCLSLWFSL